MTKEEKIKEFVEFCGDLAISNDSVNEETVLNFINSIQSKENNGWIKIESEDDLPNENGMYHVHYSDGVVSSRFYHNKHNDWSNEPKATHYQPIVKPKPPIY